MKKLLQMLLPVLVLGILLSGCGRKATPAEDFSYKMDSGEVIITGYHGTEREIVIPEEIEGRPVTRIGKDAFRDYDLTSIDLPDSLLVIEGYAFVGCDCLESISFGKNLVQIGDYAFSHCEKLQKVSLPDGLTKISYAAFLSCTGLQSVSLPDNLGQIEERAFEYCTSLESVSMPDSLVEIGESAFKGCASLQSVELNEGLWALGSNSFGECENLKELELPDNFGGFVRLSISKPNEVEQTFILSPVLYINSTYMKRMGTQYTVLVVKEGSRTQSLLDEAIEWWGDSEGYRYITK